jgi:hypothetical protein
LKNIKGLLKSISKIEPKATRAANKVGGADEIATKSQMMQDMINNLNISYTSSQELDSIERRMAEYLQQLTAKGAAWTRPTRANKHGAVTIIKPGQGVAETISPASQARNAAARDYETDLLNKDNEWKQTWLQKTIDFANKTGFQIKTNPSRTKAIFINKQLGFGLQAMVKNNRDDGLTIRYGDLDGKDNFNTDLAPDEFHDVFVRLYKDAKAGRVDQGHKFPTQNQFDPAEPEQKYLRSFLEQDDVDEGWKQKVGAAALYGAAALGGYAAGSHDPGSSNTKGIDQFNKPTTSQAAPSEKSRADQLADLNRKLAPPGSKASKIVNLPSDFEEDAASNDPLLAKAIDLAPVKALEENAELKLILRRAKLIE